MSACEKCWYDAYVRSRQDVSKSQAEHYTDLIEERKDKPCSETEQTNRCPQCDEPLENSGGHGPYCPNDTCKWGWEVEMDGSPLKTTVAGGMLRESATKMLIVYKKLIRGGDAELILRDSADKLAAALATTLEKEQSRTRERELLEARKEELDEIGKLLEKVQDDAFCHQSPNAIHYTGKMMEVWANKKRGVNAQIAALAAKGEGSAK